MTNRWLEVVAVGLEISDPIREAGWWRRVDWWHNAQDTPCITPGSLHFIFILSLSWENQPVIIFIYNSKQVAVCCERTHP